VASKRHAILVTMSRNPLFDSPQIKTTAAGPPHTVARLFQPGQTQAKGGARGDAGGPGRGAGS